MRILQLSKETKSNILEDLLKRSPNSYGGSCGGDHRYSARKGR